MTKIFRASVKNLAHDLFNPIVSIESKRLEMIKKRNIYGRRQSRPLNKSRAEAFEALMPALSIPEELLTEERSLDPGALFEKPLDEYRLEIGFGSGEYLSALLRQYPNIGFIGAEPYINGMAAFLKSLKSPLPPGERVRVRGHSEEKTLTPALSLKGEGAINIPNNIRVLMDDALLLVHALTDSSIDKIYVLNPDPWPKKRHHKRRIINQENLDQFARILKPGGELIMATDVDDLAEWMITQASIHPDFEWSANSSKSWRTPPAEWLETRYAQKGRNEGRSQSFLIFRKNH